MHVCHLLLKQPVQALLVLQGIPAKLRSVKVNMALGKLYLFLQYFFWLSNNYYMLKMINCLTGKLYVMNGLERPAISAFKEVLRECPLALEAIQSLIKLGVGHGELLRLIFVSGTSSNLEW